MNAVCNYRVAAVERQTVLYYSANYIFSSSGIIGLIVVSENGVLLMYTMEGVSSIANLITAYEESQ